MGSRRLGGVVTLAAAAIAGTANGDDGPVRDAAALSRLADALCRATAERHVALARRLEGAKHAREAWCELLLAIQLDPDCAPARLQLGQKRGEDGRFVGPFPPQPPPAKGDAPKDVAAARERERREAALRFSSLALRAKAGGLEADARRLAGLALDESPDEDQARVLLRHESRGPAWASPREVRLRAAFGRALARTDDPTATKGAEDAALAKLLGLGDLERRESIHAVLFATRAAPAVDFITLARAAEASWDAWRYFLDGDSSGFGLEGDPAREATGPGAAKVRFLIVADEEHALYVDRAVRDAARRDHVKKLAGEQRTHDLGAAGKVLVLESRQKPEHRAEWVAGGVALFLTSERVAAGAPVPALLVEGLMRFFSSHVSGRADISYVGGGSGSGKRPFGGGSRDDLRGEVRFALQETPEGDLRALLSKTMNELERMDSAIALAFVDWLLATRRAELAKLLVELRKDALPLPAVERVLGKGVLELEKELRSFVREEY